ncbi:MAG: 50S ribosomal protein L5 [Acidobacteria bacterium]|nr:50S ribosomal protein L5 [Acidobacteriota bacterium]
MAKDQQQQKKPDQQQKKGDKKGKGAAAEPEQQQASNERPKAAPKTPPRLKERFEKEIAPALMKEFELDNPMAVPRLHKIVINMGVGEATQNAKLLDPAVTELGQITGQKPVVTRAKKSIAAFKVRENMPIGAMVTLRGPRMYEFLDRLVNVALPRVRDFRGVSTKSFDGRGNYTLGLRDQLVFPEIDYAKVDKMKGMNVTIVTTARSDNEARSLLKHLGMPFRQ